MPKIISIIPLPEWLDQELWDDFISYREEIKKPMTPTAIKRLLIRLGRFVEAGGHVETMIENSINSGKWSNVYFSKKEVIDEENRRFSKPETGADVHARQLRSILRQSASDKRR